MFSWCSGLNGELAVCTFLKSIKPWMWVLDFVRELWLERTHCWRSCWGQHAPELMYWRLSMAWRRTLYCLQFNEVVYLACPLLKYQMAEVLFWLKDIFFFQVRNTQVVNSCMFSEGERVSFSMTGNRIEIWHISSLTLFFSRCPRAKMDNDGNSSARTVGQSFRYLPHRSQTCSLRKRRILMAEWLLSPPPQP